MTEERKQWLNEYLQETPKMFVKWKETGNIYAEGENDRADVFISDGIAVPELWFQQDVRPLFILKEAYDASEDHKDWDEVEWFITGGHKHGKILNKTWRTIANWSGYIFTHTDWHWDECAYRSEQHKGSPYDLYLSKNTWENPFLKHIAVMNIKKYGGHASSNDADLRKHAEAHYELIYRQIELIKPTVIICGHTAWLLDIVWKKMFGQPFRLERNSTWVYDVPNLICPVKLLDYWHPSSSYCTINGAYTCIDYLFRDNKAEDINEGHDDD